MTITHTTHSTSAAHTLSLLLLSLIFHSADEFTAYITTCVKAQGICTVLPVVVLQNNLSNNTALAHKKAQNFKKTAEKYLFQAFDIDITICSLSLLSSSAMDITATATTSAAVTSSQSNNSNSNITAVDIQHIYRCLGEQKLKTIHWRVNRPYMLVSIHCIQQ